MLLFILGAGEGLPVAFTDLLTSAQSSKEQLCCLEPYDPDTSSTVTLYYSTQGFTSEPDDSPANQSYPPRIKGSFEYTRSLYAENKLSGRSVPGFGAITLNNSDTALDVLAGYSWKGSRVRVWLGESDFDLEEYGLIFDGYADTVEFGDSDFTINLSDSQLLLDGEIQTAAFLGTGGAEGSADFEGKLKSFSLGVSRNVAPAYLGPDTGQHLFSVGDGPIVGVLRVLDVGVPLTFVASSPSAGEWTVDVTTGLITFGGDFIGPVTVDVVGRRYLSAASSTAWTVAVGSQTFAVPAGLAMCAGMTVRVGRTSALHSIWGDGVITTYSGTALTVNVTSISGAAGPFSDWTISPWGTVAGAIKYLAGLRGVTAFNDVAFAALDILQPGTIGHWVAEGGNALDVMDKITDGAGCYYGGSRNGLFGIGRLDVPGLSLATYNDVSILKLTRLATADPVHKVIFQYRKNNNVLQLNQVDGTAADADKTFLTTTWRQAVAEDASVLTAYPQAATITIDGVLDDPLDAAAEAARQLALFKVRRDYFSADLKVQPLAHELAQTISIQRNRYGLSAGKDLIIVSADADLNKYQITCGLWG